MVFVVLIRNAVLRCVSLSPDFLFDNRPCQGRCPTEVVPVHFPFGKLSGGLWEVVKILHKDPLRVGTTEKVQTCIDIPRIVSPGFVCIECPRLEPGGSVAEPGTDFQLG